MTSPTPTLPVKLTREKEASKFAGVSAAIAERLDVDPLVVRALFVLAGLCGGAGVVTYLSIWALTPSSTTNQAPLDRIGTLWRRISEPIYLIAIALAALFIGSLIHFPLGIEPLVVIGISALIGSQLRYRPPKPAPLFVAPNYQPAIEPPARAKATGRRTRFLLLSASIIAGAIFGLATGSLAYGCAAALAGVALSLLIMARGGGNAVLIVTGVLLAVVALSSAFVQRYWVEEPDVVHADGTSKTVVDSRRVVVIVDAPPEVSNMVLTARYSDVTLALPDDRDVTITVDGDEYSTFFTATQPEMSFEGNDTWVWHGANADEADQLEIDITAESSRLEAGS